MFAELVRIGEACHARWDGGEARYAHREHWVARRDLGAAVRRGGARGTRRRYFRCYGPATVNDLAYWRGGAAADARRWVAALGGELVPVEVATPTGSREMLMLAADAPGGHRGTPGAGSLARCGCSGGSIRCCSPTARRIGWCPRAPTTGCGGLPGTSRAWCSNTGARWPPGGTNVSARPRLSIRVFPFQPPLPRHVGQEVRRQGKEVARFFGLKLAGVRIERSAAARP